MTLPTPTSQSSTVPYRAPPPPLLPQPTTAFLVTPFQAVASDAPKYQAKCSIKSHVLSVIYILLRIDWLVLFFKNLLMARYLVEIIEM